MKFGCVGCGKMGYAIICGIHGLFDKKNIFIYEINQSQAQRLKAEGYNIVGSCNELFSVCDVILLAVKPQDYKKVIDSVKDTKKCNLIISIMAGVPIKAISQINPNLDVARVMPNTCAVIRESASSICYKKKYFSKKQRNRSKNIR